MISTNLPDSPIPRLPHGGGGLSPLNGVQAALLLLAVIFPLSFPFALSSVEADKLVGWWASATADAPGGGPAVTRIMWHAGAAGLKPGAVILEVDGERADAETLERVRHEAVPGDTLELLVVQEGTETRVAVPVLRSSLSYRAYGWFRIFLAIASWVAGVALVVRAGAAAPALPLGAGLLLVGPVMFPGEIVGGSPLLRVADGLWHLEGAAYRFFFPALLLHFFALHAGAGTILGSRRFWAGVYAVLFATLLVVMDFFARPLAWAVPGTLHSLRAAMGLAFELLALAGIFALRRRIAEEPRPVRWLAFATVLVLLAGVPLSAAILTVGERSAIIETLRQVKSLTMLLLPPMAALYLSVRWEKEGPAWATRRRIASSASVVLTVLYAFAVAGAGAIVLSALGRSLGGAEWVLFGAVFAAAIVFSPVLRWSREMVDRRLYARWSELKRDAEDFVDRISSDLELHRIAERVAEELPLILDVDRASLLFCDSFLEPWPGSERSELAGLPDHELREALRSVGDSKDGTALPLHLPDRGFAGILRVGPRTDRRAFEPPEHAILRTVAHGLVGALRNAETYRELLQVREELAESERLVAMGALVAGLAHEIKNPLAGLKMGLHLLDRDGVDPEKLARMEHDLRRIDDLVSGLFRFTRSDGREDPRVLDLSALTRECVDDVRALVEDRGGRVLERYSPEKALIRAIPGQLRLVVSNLLANALDAVGEGDRVEVDVTVLPEEVHLSVRDTGPGIAADVEDRIFDLEFSTKPRGTGLGLALARREIERLGGTITVQSDPEAGTELHVGLRRVMDAPEASHT